MVHRPAYGAGLSLGQVTGQQPGLRRQKPPEFILVSPGQALFLVLQPEILSAGLLQQRFLGPVCRQQRPDVLQLGLPVG